MLSTLHQSSLGGLFLMAPTKLHPLWYSPFIPAYFFISSIAAGLSMVIVESALSHRAFEGRIDHKTDINGIALGLAIGQVESLESGRGPIAAWALATGQDHHNPNKRFAGNRPNSVLLADRLTPRSMGALLALYENKIAFQGFCWNINSFDQEGVQLGKVLADRLLAEIAARNTGAAGMPAENSLESLLLAATGI